MINQSSSEVYEGILAWFQNACVIPIGSKHALLIK